MSDVQETILDGQPITYTVRQSVDASTPRIDVDIEGVTVVLPTTTDDSIPDPAALLIENSQWVLKKYDKYERYRNQAPERTFAPGETFPYLGEPYELVIERRSASDVDQSKLRLARHHVDQTSVEHALRTLYRRLARTRFEERADHFATAMGVEYEALEVRNQRTKWGSCSTTGTLGLNWRLMMAPPEIIDYVIVHELAHLIEPNHTRAFWSLVADHDPDYRSHADWLEEHSARLMFNEDDL